MHPIKQYTKDHDMTLRAFAVLVKKSAPFITQITRGQRRPSAPLALKIEEATGGAVTRMELLYPEQKNTEPGE